LQRHTHVKAYLALGAICFFWGTTYLAIRMALESFPPLTMVSLRFIVSGSILLAAALAARARLPKGRELMQTAVNGILILGLGNSCLTIAELWIPSGLAALIITTSPLWMVGLDALLPGGDRLRRAALGGILLGGAGAVILVAPEARAGAVSGGRVWAAFFLLQLANFAWSLGSIRQRRMPAGAHPIVSGGVQQLAAGLAAAPLALLERGRPVVWDLKGIGAILYLVVFGSIVGYSAYIYAMDKLPVALVSTYTYINPIVALWLGWLFYREPFGVWQAAGMLVIFVGVAVVKRFSAAPTAAEVD
jgi:drug/metabolite transporter (DMT)-like permease